MTAPEGYHYYEGVLFYENLFPASSLDAMKEFEVRKDDLYVLTFPKSGTTWAIQIASLIRGSGDLEETDRMPLYARVPFLELVKPQIKTPGHKLLESMESPRYIKSHLLKRLLPQGMFHVKPKVIYVARNPKDVLISYYEFKLHPWSWEEYFNNFLKGNVVHGCWFENIAYWWQHRNDDNVLFLFYEDMKNDLKGSVRKISNFLDKQLDENTLDEITRRSSFDVMKENKNANYKTSFGNQTEQLRFGKAGGWRSRLTPEESQAIDETFNARLAEIGLEFKY
ncbi:sulfotransferase 1 family member D1-like [Ptychodera flava]|uniref:sulfotransferase 1 family member D1-like n=1 Tax=Ptychodera flava TaxID=63121 RepID=UPI00396AB0F2